MPISSELVAKVLELISDDQQNLHNTSSKIRNYLQLDEPHAKLLYTIHKLGAVATMETIEECTGLDSSTVSKFTANLRKAGYIRLHYVIEPKKKKLYELELEVNNCVSFRDSAALLLSLLSYVDGDVEKKVSVSAFVNFLYEGNVLSYFERDDLIGTQFRRGVLDSLEESEYIERTVNFIRPRHRITLEKLFLHLIQETIPIEFLKNYSFPVKLLAGNCQVGKSYRQRQGSQQ